MAILLVNLLLVLSVTNYMTSLTFTGSVFMLIWLLLTLKLFFTSSHVLTILLTLEVLMLGLIFLLILINFQFFSNSGFLMFLLTMAVSEASLGLGLLIQLSRKMGSDLLSLF